MKVAHILYGFTLGGIETMLVNISHFQAEFGAEVHIIVINDLIDESLVSRLDPRVKLHTIKRKKGSHNPVDILKLNLTLLRINPDIIHVHQSSIAKLIRIPGARQKTCSTLHDMCNPGNTKGIQQIRCNFAISEKVRDSLKNYCGIESTTVYNAIDTSKIVRKSDFRTTGPVRLLNVSRLEIVKKGQDILVRAVARLLKEGREVHLTLVGGGYDYDVLVALAKEEGIEDKVTFMNEVPHDYVLSHLADYDIYVHPSRVEGFGLTVAEAMAAGVPVAVADNDGPMEIIAQGKYGSFFRTDDVESCAEAIARLIDSYPDKERIENAVRRIHDCFDVRTTARQYLRQYQCQLKGTSEGVGEAD